MEAIKLIDILSVETGEVIKHFNADSETALTAVCKGLKALKKVWNFCDENGIEKVNEEVHNGAWEIWIK